MIKCFLKWLKRVIDRWVLAKDEEELQSQGHTERKKGTKGRIHIVTPDGRVELIADFDNKEDFARIKAFVNNEDIILFPRSKE